MNKKGVHKLYKKLLLGFILCCTQAQVWSQNNTTVINSFALVIHPVSKDSGFKTPSFGLQTVFNTEMEVLAYVNKIPQLLTSMGYPVASVDSTWRRADSFHIQLYTGQRFQWVQLSVANIDKQALDAAGYAAKNFRNKPLNMPQLQALQERLLNYFEKQGYPFASVYLDSITLSGDKMSALLKADRGVLYHIDSIRMFGKMKLSKKFLQRYLAIENGSNYNKQKLQQVDKKMLELPFVTAVQPSDVTMLGSGAVLNLYGDPKKSSQVNFLLGFLPASSDNSKLQLTGDVNLDLKNMFGGAEEILVKWQQLQPKSPRLNLGFTQPYIFNSPFGLNFLFDLFKKDSNFLQLNAQAGVQYYLSANQFGKLFLQWQNNTLLSGAVDTNMIKNQKLLPPNIDVSAVNVGVNYDLMGTNYRFNPRKGNEISFSGMVGIKNIRQNADITSIKDPSFNYASLYDSIKPKSYQVRLKVGASHYFPIAKTATLKTTVNTGYYTSPNIFRNELFQIGGYKLLRGFNEESIYASRYAVFTAEYRYLIGLNSFLFVFTDVGYVKNKFQQVNINNQFVGAGLGIMYETRAGLLNLSYALGKRDDVKFNIREASKLHFGYINYF
jgi:outer membrane protein assembly factor BamA